MVVYVENSHAGFRVKGVGAEFQALALLIQDEQSRVEGLRYTVVAPVQAPPSGTNNNSGRFFGSSENPPDWASRECGKIFDEVHNGST